MSESDFIQWPQREDLEDLLRHTHEAILYQTTTWADIKYLRDNITTLLDQHEEESNDQIT